MAENQGALPDISKANFYGQDDSSQQKLLDALESSQKALEQRYENPNWFNVAAGFLKPQLGGFSASLGSANQAMGENLEKQRANELTVAQQRAQIGLMKNQMGQKQSANALVAAHKGPVTEDLLREVVARTGANSDIAQSVKAQLEGERANQGILAQQQTLRQGQSGQALQLAQQQFSSGAISREVYQKRLADIEASYSPTQPVTSTRPIGAPGTTEKVEGAPSVENIGAAVGPPGAYTNASALPKLADVKNIPFDTAAEIAKTKASLSSLNPQDRVNALQYIKDLESKPAPPAQREVIPSVFGKNSGLTPEQIATAVKPQEEAAQKRYMALQEVGAEENYRPLERAVSNQIDLMSKNKEASTRISAVLSKGGPENAFLAAINEGIGISINGLSGQVRLPVETFIRANFKPQDQDLAMAMANNYAAIALAKQKMGSVNPNSARNSELGLYAGLTPSLHTSHYASMRNLLHFKQDLDFTKTQYDDATHILSGEHPRYVRAEDDPAIFSAAMRNPGYAKLYEPFAEKHKKIDEAFNKSLQAKP